MTPDLSASKLRESLLAHTVFIALGDLLSLSWALGIPVIHLKVFPLKAKRMCAMSVKVRDRYAILLAKDSKFPAQIAYYLAHELGHIAQGHLEDGSALVDIEDPLRAPRTDPEELAADRYALEVLTGEAEPTITTENTAYSAAGLARAARQSAEELRIEPGTIALCFGHSTERWDKTMAALKHIYPNAHDVSLFVNRVAAQQLADGDASDENAEFVRAAMGLADE